MTSHMWLSRSRVLSATVLALIVAALLGVTSTPAQAAGNDYPYASDTSGAADPWGFTRRQCVSFVGFRMFQNRHAMSNVREHWGSAYHWDEAARSLGRTVTLRPKVGAVAQWNAGEDSRFYAANGAIGTMKAGSYGHVAYVSAVYTDGSVRIEHYNMTKDRYGRGTYSSHRVLRGEVPRFIYVY
jgi:surface antigen